MTAPTGIRPESSSVFLGGELSVVAAYCCMQSDEQEQSPFPAADFSLWGFSFNIRTMGESVGCQSVADKSLECVSFCI